MKSKAIIIDGHNFLFKGFYGVPDQVKMPDGTPINAIYGFFSLLRKAIEATNPEYLVVVFDSETSADEKKLKNPEYKANRVPQNNSMFFQLSLIKKCLEIMDIYWVEDKSNEADDIIATYSKKFNEKDVKACICSDDHDFMQLVCTDISILRGFRGNWVRYVHSDVVGKFKVTPEQYLDYLALVGDPSDNIKGIKGIGRKRATDILLKYKSIANVYKAFDSLPINIKKLLQDQEEGLIQRKNFLKIDSNIKLHHNFKIENFSLTKKSVPDKMGEFLTTHWKGIV